MELENFIKAYPSPDPPLPMHSFSFEKYSEVMPPEIIQLWEKRGIGKYGDGLIELIDLMIMKT